MHRAALTALLSYWVRHPVQLLSLLLGLALATALWSGVQAINAEARASYARAATLLGQDRFERLATRDGQPFDQTVYVALRRAGWQVSPVIDAALRTSAGRVRLLGMDAVTAPRDALPDPSVGDVLAGRGGPSAFAAPQTVAALTADPVAGLPPLVATDAVLPGVVVTDVGIVQELTGNADRLSWLIVLPDQPLLQTPLETVAPGLVRQPPEAQAGVAALTDSFHLNLTAFGFLSFAVGLFIVHGSIGLAFEQRRPMLRSLRALGLPLNSLIALLTAEVVLLALLAGVLGVVLGYAIAVVLLPDVAASLRGLYGAAIPGTLSLRPSWWGGGLAIAVVGALAAAGQSLWRLARLPVLAPAQPRAWARASARALRVQALAALVLLAAAAVLGATAEGLIGGFAMLGALLLGAALALPPVLSWVLHRAGQMARAVLPQWFWADTRQQLPGLSLALMALLLALAANVGVGTMVSSFRLTFLGWLDQRLVAELYVTARNEDEAAAMRAWLSPRSDALLPIWNVEVTAAGMPTFVYGVADHATYRDHWPLLRSDPDAWDRLAMGEAVLINEQMARRADMWPGDRLILPGDDAGFDIAGVYSDYGNPTGQVMMGQARFEQLYPHAPRLRYAVRVAPEQAGALAQALMDRFGLPADNVTDQSQVKAASRRVFERTFTVTAALNVLTLAVAGVAMLTSLLTLAGMRLPQLAPVWALGLPRAGLARLELLRALMLAGLTMALAVPVGLALAWGLLAVVNVAAFGWRLPMFIFPWEWARLALLALLASGLAALWPALRLARIAPSDLLKVFANER